MAKFGFTEGSGQMVSTDAVKTQSFFDQVPILSPKNNLLIWQAVIDTQVGSPLNLLQSYSILA